MQTIKSYGRSRGRPLSNLKSSLVETRLDEFLVPEIWGQEVLGDVLTQKIDPKDLMPNAKEVWFEIGFGGGEHMVNQARNNPDVLIIGAEPFFDGVAKVLAAILEYDIKNIRIINDDARKYLKNFKDNSLERMFILFPDPWQKARHRKRRLVNSEFSNEITRVLAENGKLRFATDWADYADTALMVLTANNSFEWAATKAADWAIPPSDHCTTRYEVKGLGDCAPHFFDFRRV